MLHVAGGGLIGGLGGGGVGSAMQGAAGAGLASSLAGTTKQIADAIGAETGSDLLGKLAGNTLAGIGGGIVGGTTGAAAAANVNLYNQWRDSGSTDIDTLEQAAGISDGGKRTSTLERILQGIALAANAVLGMEGGPPPGASPSAVLVNSAAGALPAQALAGQGIAPSHAIFNDGGGGTTSSGNVTVEAGATPDANELRAGQGLASLGHDVVQQATASSQGVPNVRTADLSVSGVGQVDVYTPGSETSLNAIVRTIEKKSDQASGVLVQADLSNSDMASIADRTWGKPSAQSIHTLFFQKSDGTIVRFNRPVQGS
ncbi:hypothetical protein [Burkholderia sp. SJZ115]